MIRANSCTFVKVQALSLFLLIALFGQPLFADDLVKSIEVEEFQVKVLKTSKSGKVFMLEDTDRNRPATGKVLLLKSNQTEIMAVRVLKNYSGKFAARLVLKFKDVTEGTELRALKKIGDRVKTIVADRDKRNTKDSIEAAEDRALLKEIAPDDVELDKDIPGPTATTKPIKKSERPLEVEKLGTEKLDEEKLDEYDKTANKVEPLFDKKGHELSQGDVEVSEDVEESYYDPNSYEISPLESYRNAFSFQYASINSYDSSSNSTTYSALGLRYSNFLARMVLFDRKSVQDTIGIELSAFTYSISNFRSPNDTISVLPLEATMRYSLLFGEYISFFTYAGVIQSIVTSSTNVNDVEPLRNTAAAFGGGAQLRIGPAWAIRIDYGIEMFAAGITLKF